jgi:WD40 repeat protein
MLPHLKFDNSTNELFITDANEFVCLHLNEIRNYTQTKQQEKRLNQIKNQYSRPGSTSIQSINNIKINNKFKIFEPNQDINSFIKKENYFLNISKQKLTFHELQSNNDFTQLFEIEENLINCADFIPNNKLVYGCSDGSVKVLNLTEDSNNNLIKVLNIPDRILRCVVSPLDNNLAIGTAGIQSLPVRVYDLERFKEINSLKPFNNKPYKRGAGVLALSYIDENTLMAAGYDTFIRIFDLRSNNWYFFLLLVNIKY